MEYSYADLEIEINGHKYPNYYFYSFPKIGLANVEPIHDENGNIIGQSDIDYKKAERLKLKQSLENQNGEYLIFPIKEIYLAQLKQYFKKSNLIPNEIDKKFIVISKKEHKKLSDKFKLNQAKFPFDLIVILIYLIKKIPFRNSGRQNEEYFGIKTLLDICESTKLLNEGTYNQDLIAINITIKDNITNKKSKIQVKHDKFLSNFLLASFQLGYEYFNKNISQAQKDQLENFNNKIIFAQELIDFCQNTSYLDNITKESENEILKLCSTIFEFSNSPFKYESLKRAFSRNPKA